MNDLTNRILNLAIAIQQIPAPTFHEAARAEFVCARFSDEDLADVEMDGAGNVYARLAGFKCRPGPADIVPAKYPPKVPEAQRRGWGEGEGSGKALVVSAHLDTIFP
ncbi:MAG: hypothetical protein NTV38_14715, partial [Chloroflexi bacterium]|nr:hypothetical protein [Chloroflexota bacterium]